jgi:predicted P-loop ATPase
MNNLLLALASPAMIGRHLAYDTFKDELIWAANHCDRDHAQWRLFRDADYALIRQQLELRGFKPMGHEMMKLAILTVAEDHEIDTAQEWLKRLAWDGRSRVAEFTLRGWGWADTPYSRAVGRYTWSALAGRVLQPGIQADMAPILVGPQGAGKTTAIMAMAPDAEFYASIKLDDHDADTSRLLRGTLVAELEELRGLNSRAVEEIKAWITKRHEKWVPKYREFATTFGRRNLFFGTTNEDEFLADPTGERRWLPGKCGHLDTSWIVANRDQLWAEGMSMFLLDGIDWEQAETLARLEHEQFKVSDGWTPYVARWLHDESDVRGKPIEWPHIHTHEALSGALGMAPGAINKGQEMRMGKVLRALGFERGKVKLPGARTPINAYKRV